MGDDEGTPGLQSVNLNSEKDYKEFGKNVGQTLYGGKAPYRIENFYKNLGNLKYDEAKPQKDKKKK